jgi:hypothetical protein
MQYANQYLQDYYRHQQQLLRQQCEQAQALGPQQAAGWRCVDRSQARALVIKKIVDAFLEKRVFMFHQQQQSQGQGQGRPVPPVSPVEMNQINQRAVQIELVSS